VFKKLGQKPSGTNCPGLITEADEISGEIDDKSVLDAAILANAPPMSKSSASGSDF
jgi:ferritin-like metal-binding protein YciE